MSLATIRSSSTTKMLVSAILQTPCASIKAKPSHTRMSLCPRLSGKRGRPCGVHPHRRQTLVRNAEEIPIPLYSMEEIPFDNQRLHATIDLLSGEAIREHKLALVEIVTANRIAHVFQLPLKQLKNDPLDCWVCCHGALLYACAEMESMGGP